MKNILIVALAFISCSQYACSQNKKEAELVQFRHHFQVLDSIANVTASDTLRNCHESVRFMEKNTGIEATTDGNYFGRFSCKKSDLQKWHEWYDKKYKKDN